MKTWDSCDHYPVYAIAQENEAHNYCDVGVFTKNRCGTDERDQCRNGTGRVLSFIWKKRKDLRAGRNYKWVELKASVANALKS